MYLCFVYSLFNDETENVNEENVVNGDKSDSDAESSDDELWSEDSDDLDCRDDYSCFV